MKKLMIHAFLLIALLALFTPVQSQEKKKSTPEERATKLTEWMKTNLKLTPEQEPKVHEINLKYAKKSQEVKNSGGEKAEKSKAIKANDQAKDEELKKILTPEQFNMYQAKKDELKMKMKEEKKAHKQAR